MAFNFENLDWQCGQTAVPGVYHDIYYAPKCIIETWPTLSSAPTSAAEEVTYSGSFALVTADPANTWKKINAIDVKTAVTSEGQGELRAQSFLNKATIATGMTKEEATAFAKIANNTDIVYIVREKNSGKYRIIGNEMFHCKTMPKLDLGGEPTSERGMVLEIECSDPVPLPFYDGSIVTDDGDVNPQT